MKAERVMKARTRELEAEVGVLKARTRELEAEVAVLKASEARLEAEVGVLKASEARLEARLEAQVRRAKDAWRQIRQILGYALKKVEA
jgi:hypothetical protein